MTRPRRRDASHHRLVRKLIVSDFQTVDGYYESKNKTDYWVSYPDTPGGGTAVRREFAELVAAKEKYVVSDTIASDDLRRCPS